MNRATPVYLTYRLPDRSLLVACWNWQRLFFAEALPEAWEQIPEGETSPLKARCIARGYRLLHVLEPRKIAVWKQIQSIHFKPHRTRKQKRKAQAREQRQRESAADQLKGLQKLGETYRAFQIQFSGLNKTQIRRVYHRLSYVHHPDLGGQSESFNMLNKAYREALEKV